MKLKKRILSLILALTLCLSLSANAFAAETSNVPEVKKETVTFTLDSGESTTAVQPRMWNDGTFTLNPGTVTYTGQFVIPDRYFAYEMTGRYANGSTSSETYSVDLLLGVTDFIAHGTGVLDGNTYKNDWIDISGDIGSSFSLKITNNSSSAITVSLTWYSWA